MSEHPWTLQTMGRLDLRIQCNWEQDSVGRSGRDAAGALEKVQRGGIKVFNEQNGCVDKEMEE